MIRQDEGGMGRIILDAIMRGSFDKMAFGEDFDITGDEHLKKIREKIAFLIDEGGEGKTSDTLTKSFAAIMGGFCGFLDDLDNLEDEDAALTELEETVYTQIAMIFSLGTFEGMMEEKVRNEEKQEKEQNRPSSVIDFKEI